MPTPVSEFIVHLQNMDEARFAPEVRRYDRAAAALVEAADDAALLERYRRALANALAWTEAEDGADGERPGMVRTLLRYAERLKHATPRDTDLDVRALSAMVREKRNADAVLRALVHRPMPPKDLLEKLGLEPPQLHRVLQWALAAGLVERSGIDRNVVYAISRMGEVALRGIDEPAWLPTAGVLLRLTLEARLRERPVEAVVAQGTDLSGLTGPEIERTYVTFCDAADPAGASALAAALGAPYSQRRVLLEPGTGRASALVACALERAGIHGSGVEWWEGGSGTRRPPLQDCTLLSIGNPGAGTLGSEVVSDFGSLVSFDATRLCLSTQGSAFPEAWTLEDDTDYGVVVRYYAPTTGHSHFLIGGIGDQGTVAASRLFYSRIESLLDEHEDHSFALVVRAHAAANDEPEVVGATRRLDTPDPYAERAPEEPIEEAVAPRPRIQHRPAPRPSIGRMSASPRPAADAWGTRGTVAGDRMDEARPLAAEPRHEETDQDGVG